MEVASGINYWAVLVAGLVYFALGAVWYSKILFGNAWMRLIGKTEEQAKAEYSPWKLVWVFIASLLAAYGVARLLSMMTDHSAYLGFMVGLLVGLDFALVFISVNDVMEGRPLKLTVINILYNVIGLLIMGLIIGGWR